MTPDLPRIEAALAEAGATLPEQPRRCGPAPDYEGAYMYDGRAYDRRHHASAQYVADLIAWGMKQSRCVAEIPALVARVRELEARERIMIEALRAADRGTTAAPVWYMTPEDTDKFNDGLRLAIAEGK